MNTNIKMYVNELLGRKLKPVILEIGAHYGEDTKEMLNVFYCPQVYCFEPHPGNAAFLRKFFAHQNSVYIHEVALSIEDGEASLNVVDNPLGDKPLPEKYSWIDEQDYRELELNDSGGCSLKSGYNYSSCKTIIVKTMRLDAWDAIVQLDEIDFIWMDVQGAEKDVILGGEETFKKTKYVWTEYGELLYDGAMNKRETIDLFSKLNMKPLKVDKNDILFAKEA